jgi:flavin reductase (DIM6/NTAB) family NADH-FMN oxidoreductase RutF
VEPLVSLDCSRRIWERFFAVAPLVLIGTSDPGGAADFAPKHMVTPMGWDNYFGFVCTPRHGTYQNVERTGVFTVTFPRPSQVLRTSLAASPRCGDDEKPVLQTFETFEAESIDGQFLADGYAFLECEKFRVIDGFGENSLITGRVLAARVDREALRVSDRDDQDIIRAAPLLAYVHPWRFSTIDSTNRFPEPEGMKK